MGSEEVWQDMDRMVEQESLWLPGAAKGEVREALEELYRTGDPASLAPFLRQGTGTQQTQNYVLDVPDVTNVPPNNDDHEVADMFGSDKDGLKNTVSNPGPFISLEIDQETDFQRDKNLFVKKCRTFKAKL